MAFDAFTLAVVGLATGALFGALNAIFGWLKSGDSFEPRKFAITTLTGIGAGLVFVFANITGIVEATNNYELLTQLAFLAFAIFGVNFVRTVGSELVSQRAVEKTE